MTALTLADILALPYVAYEDRLSLPRVPGLYCAVLDRETIGYVGVTVASLRQRWMAHHRRYALLDMGAVSIAYLEGDGLEEVERATIATLAPSLNVRDVPKAARLSRPPVPRGVLSTGMIPASFQITKRQLAWIRAELPRLGARSVPHALRILIQEAMDAEAAAERESPTLEVPA